LPKKPQTSDEQSQIRARIQQVAREVYDAEGYAAVTIRNVARRSGYSPAALYRYFSGQLELVRSIWQEAVDNMRDDASVAITRHEDPLERVVAVLRSYANFAAAEPAAFRSTFLQTGVPGENAKRLQREGPLPTLDPSEGTAYRVLRETISEAMAAGRMMSMDVDIAAQTLWGSIHGVVALPFHFARFPLADRERRVEAALRMIVRAMEVGSSAISSEEPPNDRSSN
jgi:AcrR family transcriptional regulator